LTESRHATNPIHRVLHLVEDLFLSALLLTMVLFSFVQLVMKNLVAEFDLMGRHYTILPFKWLLDTVGPGFNWGDGFLRQLVLWLAIMGAAVATRQDRLINVEIAGKFLPKKWGIGVRVLTDAFTAFICGLLAYTGFRLVLTEFNSGSKAFGNVPAWFMELVIPFGFAIITIRFIRYFILHLLQSLGVVPIQNEDVQPPTGDNP
jgi:TRAP-type C4-dicarboxylate transport system permease small subunit